MAFGFNPAASNNTAWVLLRSLDLTATNSFVEIYRYDGPTGITSNSVPVFVTETPTSIEVLDETVPQPTNAFYRFEAELRP